MATPHTWIAPTHYNDRWGWGVFERDDKATTRNYQRLILTRRTKRAAARALKDWRLTLMEVTE